MFQTKRFGLVASKQEYLMLCRAEKHMKKKKKPTGQRLSAFSLLIVFSFVQHELTYAIRHRYSQYPSS